MMLALAAVFTGLQFYKARHNPQTASPNQAQTAPPSALPSASQAIGTPPSSPDQAAQTPTTVPAARSASTTPATVAAAETTTTIENELYRITFTNRGAHVTSWQLKQHRDNYKQPLDLVHDQAARQFGYPLSLYTYDAATTTALSQVLYVPSATGQLPSPASLTFKYADNGLAVTKTFSFDETYLLHADVQVTRNGAPVRALLSWPGGFGDEEDARSYASAQVDTSANGKAEHLDIKKISGGNTLNGPFDWAGVSDLYFAAVFLPDAPDTATVTTLHNQIDVAKAKRNNGLGQGTPAKGAMVVPILGAALGDVSGHTQTRIYVGPKAAKILKNIHATGPDGKASGVTLEPILDFGFFGPIGRILFYALQFIQTHVSSNWGWSIVILTIIINALLLPLRIKTMHSGLKMQRIQPQMDAIKAKYKSLKVTDPKRNEMNAEIMQLQKDNGVNMFGGCIPTLIQMPLLFAFLYMLPKVVELRQAHWLWLPDLSAADPWHILPIVMVLSQFLVQFYTPSPGVDPQQQKMMAFMMPVFSGYITWNYASGLALYWAVGNLIGIATQAVMNRTGLGREMRELAAKRARRKAGNPGSGGSGKVIQARR